MVKDKGFSTSVTEAMKQAKESAAQSVSHIGDALQMPKSASAGVAAVVTSTAVPKVNAVRWGLEQSFGPNCQLRAVNVESGIAAQPIGFNAGSQAALARLERCGLARVCTWALPPPRLPQSAPRWRHIRAPAADALLTTRAAGQR